MSKITIEEIEILVTTKVEDNLKQNMPIIKQMVDKVRQEFEKIDITEFENNIKISIKNASEVIKQKVPKIKETLDSIVDDKSKQKVIELEKEITKLEKQINSKQMKLDITSNAIDNIYDAEKNKQRAKDPNATDNMINNKTMLNLSQNDNFNSLVAESDKLGASIQRDNILLEATKSKLDEIKQSFSKTNNSFLENDNGQSTWIKYLQNIKQTFLNARVQFKEIIKDFKDNAIDSFKNKLEKIPKIASKINERFKNVFGKRNIQIGLKQLLKYAGALFSLRSVYNILSQSAQSWLSSQNKQAQQLNANLGYMKYAIGSAFEPIIEHVTNLIYKMLQAIQSVFYALFKVNIFAKASASSYASIANNAKKAKNETKQLAGIHSDINNISDKNNSSDNGNGAISPNIDLSNVDTSLYEQLKNIDFKELGTKLGEKINSSLEKINWNKVKDTSKTIASNIAGFINNFVSKTDWKLLGKTVGEGINTALVFVKTFLMETNFEKIGKSIGKFLSNAVKTVNWNDIGKIISEGTGDLFDAITGFFTDLDWKAVVDAIIDWVSGIDFGRIASSMMQALGAAIASTLNLGKAIGEKIGEGVEEAKKYFNKKIEECGGNVVKGIFKGIGDAIKNVGTWINDKIFKPFIEGFKKAFKINSPSKIMENMGKNIIDGLYNGVKGIWSKVKDIFNTLKNNISGKFKDTVTKIKSNFKVSTIKSHFSNVVSGIKSVFSIIPNWFKSTFTTAWTNVKNVFCKGGKVFEGIKEGILSTFKKIVNGLIAGINKVITIPFNGINTALKKIKDVNIIGAKPFNFINTINVPQIPKLAKGNVATEPTLAMFGEYSNAKSNPEVTAPQNVLKETFREEINNNNGNQQIKIYLNIGNKKLGDILIDDLRDRKRRTGNGLEALVGG